MNQETTVATEAHRSPIRGLLQIVRFNWPRYVVGLAAIVAAAIALDFVPLPTFVFRLATIGIVAAAWWLVASLVASFWIYDLSPLTRWKWLEEYLPPDGARGRLLNVHSGFDDTTQRLRALFGPANVISVDIYDVKRMTEPSIHRARRALPPPLDSVRGTPEKLPFNTASADGALLLLAAHELRKPAERESLFRELHRALRPGSRVVLAEHARDAWNFAAFGPGFAHFYPFAEWLRLAGVGKFRNVAAGRITPFVRFLVLEK